MIKLDKKTFVLILVGILTLGGVVIYRSNIQAEINAQTEIEKQRIIQEEKTERTKSRMQWIPWFSEETE